MMWVVRAGQSACYFDKYVSESKIFLPWDGYCTSLADYSEMAEFRSLVETEKCANNRTTVSNWSSQLYAFSKEMNMGDYVLIPTKGSRSFLLGRISGAYCFDANDKDKLYHHRKMEIIRRDIPKEMFPQNIIYSLGAFRTVFKVKQEEKILSLLKDVV